MKIINDCVAFVEYTLRDDTGTVLDRSPKGEPMAYIHGADMLIDGLEHALEGRQAGDHISVTIQPDDAYGKRYEERVIDVPLAVLSDVPDVAVGTEVEIETEAGFLLATIAGLADDTATIDTNHPLAGLTLHYSVNVVDVRLATPDELAHGHVHLDDDSDECI